MATSTPIKSVPSLQDLHQLQDISTQGCDSASKIFPTHAKRPYFKKIDLLCDRLKQDLRITNKAVININSHGVAWAIKDFIFVFTRITSAWVIMRDYFYTNSEGMNCVQDSLDPNLAKDFIEWQEATMKFNKSLIRSFENLHNRDQRNGSRKTNNSFNDSGTAECPTSAKKNDSFQSLFDPQIAEDSSSAQLKGGYLKSALYQPLSSSEESPQQTPNQNVESFKFLFDDLMPDSPFKERQPLPLYKRSSEVSPKTESAMKSQYRMKSQKFDDLSTDVDGISFIEDPEPRCHKKLFKVEAMKNLYGDGGAKKVVALFDDLTKQPFINFSDILHFTNAPDVQFQFEKSLSLEVIINNIKDGKYSSVCDIFIALKMLAEHARGFQRHYQHDQSIADAILEVVRRIESALARHA